jgi:hypothetical protein
MSLWRNEFDSDNGDSASNSLPQWILDYAKDQYGVDMNEDLGQGKEIPEKPEPQPLPSWWSVHRSDMVVLSAGILVVGILIFATIWMRLL